VTVHKRQERLRIDVATEAECCGLLAQPPAGRLAGVEVVRREAAPFGVDVVRAGVCAGE